MIDKIIFVNTAWTIIVWKLFPNFFVSVKPVIQTFTFSSKWLLVINLLKKVNFFALFVCSYSNFQGMLSFLLPSTTFFRRFQIVIILILRLCSQRRIYFLYKGVPRTNVSCNILLAHPKAKVFTRDHQALLKHKPEFQGTRTCKWLLYCYMYMTWLQCIPTVQQKYNNKWQPYHHFANNLLL